MTGSPAFSDESASPARAAQHKHLVTLLRRQDFTKREASLKPGDLHTCANLSSARDQSLKSANVGIVLKHLPTNLVLYAHYLLAEFGTLRGSFFS
jgi:hypothetical protein